MRSGIVRAATFGLGLFVVVLSIGGRLLAGTFNAAPAPEIDGSSITAGLGLLSAGVLILRSRRRSK